MVEIGPTVSQLKLQTSGSRITHQETNCIYASYIHTYLIVSTAKILEKTTTTTMLTRTLFPHLLWKSWVKNVTCPHVLCLKGEEALSSMDTNQQHGMERFERACQLLRKSKSSNNSRNIIEPKNVTYERITSIESIIIMMKVAEKKKHNKSLKRNDGTQCTIQYNIRKIVKIKKRKI